MKGVYEKEYFDSTKMTTPLTFFDMTWWYDLNFHFRKQLKVLVKFK